MIIERSSWISHRNGKLIFIRTSNALVDPKASIFEIPLREGGREEIKF
jgi:hypothetical protein